VPTLQEQFGQIDIYLFDQILRNRIYPGMRVLDAGCGSGRNLVYLLRAGYDVFGLDQDSQAIEDLRRLSAYLAPSLPPGNFQVGAIEDMTYPDSAFDLVICSAVLHFASDDRQFQAMLKQLWRVLRPGGILFCRLASSIGLEKQVKRIKGRRYLLPDGSERYLVDEAYLAKLVKNWAAELVDPIKTTVVQSQRCMTTWVLRKLGTR
jgi:SAM-dependent methyltransferase